MLRLTYRPAPLDWSIKKNAHIALLANKHMDLKNLEVGGEHFCIERVNDVMSHDRYRVSCDPKHTEHGNLLVDLLERRIITITEANTHFLLDFADQFDIVSLKKRTQKFSSHTWNRTWWLVAFRAICAFFRLLLSGFGFLGKVLMTSWDFFGVLIVVLGLLNLALIMGSMGMYASGSKVLEFVFIILPLCLFTLYLTNLMAIAVVDFFKFRMFGRENTIWPTHQRLLIMFFNVLPFKRKIKRRRIFGLGPMYNVLHGILFIIIGVLLFQQASSIAGVVRMDIVVLIFVIGIPPIKYAIMYVLYAMHAVASWFPVCRKNFVDNGDFDDAFLCAQYFSRCPVMNLLKFRQIADGPEEIYEADDIEEEGDVDQPEGKTYGRQPDYYYEREPRLALAILKAIFSKTMVCLYAVVVSIVFMVKEHAARSTDWGPSQIVVFVVVFILIIVPLGCSTSFPWFICSSFFSESYSNEQVKREFSGISKAVNRTCVFERYVRSANKFRFIRYFSAIWNGFLLLFMFIVVMAYSKSGELRVEDRDGTSSAGVASADTTNPLFRVVTSGVCSAYVKGLSIQQVLVMAAMAGKETYEEMESYVNDVMPRFFGSIKIGTDIEIIDTPFPDETFDSFLRHVILHEPYNMHVFSIRGTATMVDLAVDMELWASSAIWQQFAQFIPIYRTFTHIGNDYLDTLIALPKLIFRPFSVADAYVRPFVNYIESVKIGDGMDVLIVGHSLGGGMAKILSLITGYQGVGVSGPGTSSIRALYRNDNSSVTVRNLISINPDQDVVAAVDGQEGSLYRIPCRRGSFSCHSVKYAICQTAVMCNTWTAEQEAYCRSEFSEAEIKMMFEDGDPYFLPK